MLAKKLKSYKKRHFAENAIYQYFRGVSRVFVRSLIVLKTAKIGYVTYGLLTKI